MKPKMDVHVREKHFIKAFGAFYRLRLIAGIDGSISWLHLLLFRIYLALITKEFLVSFRDPLDLATIYLQELCIGSLLYRRAFVAERSLLN
ncbi:hypothetical protein M5K25_008631 [Dendrobium thyrsiflorum]|uniref:Uncharacterized protein n=1 Tax=Dendrobium thyrsiflorum TaxID=117978 RepID=A0ABD0VAD4_DENTH